jgi:uncharacterized protein (TIGR02466 family)
VKITDDLHVDRGDGVHLTFPTPILFYEWAGGGEWNGPLAALVRERAAASPGHRVSNIGGWQSKGDLFADAPEPLLRLRAEIHRAARRYIEIAVKRPFKCRFATFGWANINRAGDVNLLHAHGAHHISGVYYVAVAEARADDPHRGRLELQDPRAAARVFVPPGFPYGRRLQLTPAPSRMLLFPSWLDHGVLPFQGEGERISIAFNSVIRDFTYLDDAAKPASAATTRSTSSSDIEGNSGSDRQLS